MKRLNQILSVAALLTFAQAATAGTKMKCYVHEFKEGETSETLAEVNVLLDPNVPAVIYRENGNFFSVNIGTQGGLQLSIANPTTKKIVALAYTADEKMLALAGSDPLRMFSCSK